MRGPVSGAILFGLSKVLTQLLLPGLQTQHGLQRAIRKNRERGAARPPKALLRSFDFREEARPDGSLFHLTRRDSAPAPVHLLYLHGGAFVFDMQPIQYGLVSGLLNHIVADMTLVNYPLAPEATWRKSIAFAREIYLETAARLGARTLVVTGDSAGGGLALLMTQALRDAGDPLPAALVLFSPVFDLSASGDDQAALERRDPSITRALIRHVAELWAPGLDPRDPRISALFADQSGLPPTLLFTGDREVLESDALRLKRRNPDVDHRSYAEMAHVFPIGGTREGAHALREAADFVRQHTGSRDGL